jgi:hypothetical protein
MRTARKESDTVNDYRDLAPGIFRQRLVVEGYPAAPITDGDIVDYLSRLSGTLDMKPIGTPAVSRSDQYGWAGWIHWETSGAHFYAWEQPARFFSVDIYTCKPFDAADATAFTAEYFSASDFTAKEF